MVKREKQPVHKVVMTEGKRNIVRQLMEEYDIKNVEDIQEVLKDLLGSVLKEMMEAEMEDHLGYGRSDRSVERRKIMMDIPAKVKYNGPE